MKYYSELTRKIYDDEDSLKKAEEAVSEENKKKELEKKAKEEAARRVRDAFQKVADDKKIAKKELRDFNDKYGTYYYNLKDDSLFNDPFIDFCKEIFHFV